MEPRQLLQQTSTWAIMPAHLLQSIERPQNGEMFASIERCIERLRVWGFVEGCAYVKSKSRPLAPTPNHAFACIFANNKTQNHWMLEDCVERDTEGIIISRRQRDTTNSRSGCGRVYTLAYKQISRRNEALGRQWIGLGGITDRLNLAFSWPRISLFHITSTAFQHLIHNVPQNSRHCFEYRTVSYGR